MIRTSEHKVTRCVSLLALAMISNWMPDIARSGLLPVSGRTGLLHGAGYCKHRVMTRAL